MVLKELKLTYSIGPIVMHIYDKQCEIVQKNQWKSSNGRLQCFYNGTTVTSGALSWKRLFNRKTKMPVPQFFQIQWPIQGGTMSKGTARAFQKKLTYQPWEFWCRLWTDFQDDPMIVQNDLKMGLLDFQKFVPSSIWLFLSGGPSKFIFGKSSKTKFALVNGQKCDETHNT